MRYCSECKIEFNDPRNHIIEFHKPLPEPNNKGNIFCELCNTRVKNIYKHKFSTLHRYNQGLSNIIFFSSAEDFYKHFNQIKNEKEINDILNLNEENPFWITAKEELDEEEYKKLKEEIIGRQRVSGIRGKGRNIRNRNTGYRRSIRTSKSISPNSKKVRK
jgi:hypothetical protein